MESEVKNLILQAESIMKRNLTKSEKTLLELGYTNGYTDGVIDTIVDDIKYSIFGCI